MKKDAGNFKYSTLHYSIIQQWKMIIKIYYIANNCSDSNQDIELLNPLIIE